MSSGSLDSVCRKKGDQVFTHTQLRDAKANIKHDLEFLLRNSDRDPETNPFRRVEACTPAQPESDDLLQPLAPEGNTGFLGTPHCTNQRHFQLTSVH